MLYVELEKYRKQTIRIFNLKFLFKNNSLSKSKRKQQNTNLDNQTGNRCYITILDEKSNVQFRLTKIMGKPNLTQPNLTFTN